MLDNLEVLQTVKNFIHTFFVEKDLEAAMDYMTEDALFVGIGENEVPINKDELKNYFSEKFRNFMEIEVLEYEKPIGYKIEEGICYVYIQEKSPILSQDEETTGRRGSIGCRYMDGKWKIFSAHLFTANTSLEQEILQQSIVQYSLEVEKQDELYESIINRTSTGICVMNANTYEIYFANEAMFILCGKNYKDYINYKNNNEQMDLKCHQLFFDFKETCPFCSSGSILETNNGKSESDMYIESIHKHIHKIVRKIEWRGKPAFIEYVTDITSTKENEKKQEIDLHRIKSIIQDSGILYCEYNFKDKTIMQKNGLLITKSESEKEKDCLICLFNKDSIADEYKKEYKKIFEEIKKGKELVEINHPVIDENGDKHWKCVRYHTIFDENGKPLRAIVTATDIDAYKKLENQFALAAKMANAYVWTYNILEKKVIQYVTRPVLPMLPNEIPDGCETIIALGIIDPRDIPTFRTMHEQLQNGEKSVSCEIRIINADGKIEGWVRIAYVVYKESDNEGDVAWGTLVSVDEQKAAQEKYQFELQRRKAFDDEYMAFLIFNVTKGKVIEHDPHGFPVPTIAPGSPLSDFIEKVLPTCTDAKQRMELERILDRKVELDAYEKGEQLSLEYMRYAKNGIDIMWAKTTIHFMKDPNENSIIAFLYTFDVNDKKEMESIINRVTSSHFELLLLVNLDADSIEYALAPKSEKPLTLKGKSYSESLKKALFSNNKDNKQDDFLIKNSMETVVKELEKAEYYSTTFGFYNKKVGKYFYKMWRYVYFDKKKKKVLLTRTDITEIYEREEASKNALLIALETAEQANGAKTEFLSRMSHDIRTPMNAIVGMTDIALMDTCDTKQVEECLYTIQNSSLQLLALVNDILDTSRIESGKTLVLEQITDIHIVLHDMLQENEVLRKKKNIKVSLQETYVNKFCYADITRIRQILQNIYTNAIKFTPIGGTISIQAEEVLTPNQEISNYKYTITDTGIGMEKEQLAHIFEPFFRGENAIEQKIEGTGLGLSIVKNLIDIMGGVISVSSELGKGSTFVVEIPLRNPQGVDIPTCSIDNKKKKMADLTGKVFLIAEDHPINAKIVTILLEKAGAKVIVVEDGKKAVELFKTSKNKTFDIILMDIQMPVMNGYEAAGQIRKSYHPQGNTIPIIAMTANAFPKDIKMALDAGMNFHLEKPIEQLHFYEMIEKALAYKQQIEKQQIEKQ